METKKVEPGRQFLAEQGLNLYAVFDCATLPEVITQSLRENDIRPEAYSRLVLLGNGGQQLWPALSRFGMQTADPVDYYSLRMAHTFINDYLNRADHLILYPARYTVPLQQLGALAGWHHPSPLGLGINPTYGLWFAYRVAFLTTAGLPLTEKMGGSSPCHTCTDKPCFSACPAGAVQGVGRLDLPACAGYRLQAQSPCQDRCLSRLACPIAPEHRYPMKQVNYHYRHSLNSIRRYFE